MSNVTLSAGGYTFTIVPRDWRDRHAPKRVRVYAPSVTPAMNQPAWTSIGEDPANDKAWKAYNREELRLMRELLEDALQDAAAEAEVRDEGVWAPVLKALSGKLSFSRKAGCSCGCSAGFVAEHMDTLAGEGYIDQISVSRRAVDQPTRAGWERAVELGYSEDARAKRTFTMADFDQVGAAV